MTKKNISLVLIVLFVVSGLALGAQEKSEVKVKAETKTHNQLIVWSSGDREVAIKMVFMYAYNCKMRKWMDKVQLLVWGPSSKLLAGDKELQDKIKKMKEAGVELTACKACADMYGVSDKLTALGVDVKYMGVPLADMQKKGWHVITF